MPLPNSIVGTGSNRGSGLEQRGSEGVERANWWGVEMTGRGDLQSVDSWIR